MDRVAVFVDAGHLFAGGSAAMTGASKKRSEITLNVPAVAAYLEDKATKLSGLPLLRIYWYDGALAAGLTTDQQLLASTNNFKLRLGIVNGHGEQKGVDAKIVTDLAELARNAAVAEAVLIGGDEDLRIGVELAQERGVRVHLLTVEKSNVSTFLKREADTTSEITIVDLNGILTINQAPSAGVATPAPIVIAPAVGQGPQQTVGGAGAISYAPVVSDYLSQLADADKTSLATAIKSGNGGIPSDHDRKILAKARDFIGRQLDAADKQDLRKEVRDQLGI